MADDISNERNRSCVRSIWLYDVVDKSGNNYTMKIESVN